MSAEAVGWVYRFSPFTGTTLLAHHAIADSANDQYSYRFWMHVDELARKIRASVRQTQYCLRELTKNGYLECLDKGGGRGKAAEYRLLFPDVPVIFETLKQRRIRTFKSEKVHSATERVQNAEISLPSDQPQRDNPIEPKELHPNGTSPNGSVSPESQNLVAYYVDACKEFGYEPSRQMKGQIARSVKQLVHEARPRSLIEKAIRVAADENKPGRLDLIVTDLQKAGHRE